jgi:hypothetical protein
MCLSCAPILLMGALSMYTYSLSRYALIGHQYIQ